MSADYVLHESSAGYAVFKIAHQGNKIASQMAESVDIEKDLAKFGKMVELVGFAPFQNSAQALENINEVSEGILPEYLRIVLDTNLPKGSKRTKVVLGVSDRGLAGSIKAAFPGVECETPDTDKVVGDILRGLRIHAGKLLKQLQDGDIERAQLGLGHAYSRAKVKFSVQKNDNHIIQAIATLDQLDKAVNQFCMRVREWYSWHFPELIKIVSENLQYTKLVLYIGDKTTLSDDSLHDLAAIVGDEEPVAQSIIDAARISMGRDISEADMENVLSFAKRAISLAEYRKSLQGYLKQKMGMVAPNLAALIGEPVAARLISHAGSLTNLAKYPASTVQILGAEKALFRALKTKGNTPKYGLIYHSSFIGKAGARNKGRISRFLANKCSIASRIDNFSDEPTTKFGEALKKQVEERLEFYATGATPTKNEVALRAAMDSMDDALSGIQIKSASPAVGSMKMEDVLEAKTDKEARKAEKAKRKEEKRRKKEAAAGGDTVMADDSDSDRARRKAEKKKRKAESGEKHSKKKSKA